MSTHGARANKTGKTLEGIVVPILQNQYGFEVIGNPEYVKLQAKGEPLPPRVLIKNVPYTTLYGSKGKTEFLLIASDAKATKQYPLEHGVLTCRIECKWQQSSGSVDEKFPYLYLSCVEAMTEKNILILYGGGKYREGAINWLKNAVLTKKYITQESGKNIGVMNVEEFMTWASHAFD